MRISSCQCVVCEKVFTAKRIDAKTCSPACRQKLSKAKRGGDVKSKIGLREMYFNDLLVIRSHNPESANMIDNIIAIFGSVAGEWAIAAVKEALS